VPNPSFEWNGCGPVGQTINTISYFRCIPWYNPGFDVTPDHTDTCTAGNLTNYIPHPNTGNCYMGIFVYSDYGVVREYVVTKLSIESLEIDKTYCLEVYLRLLKISKYGTSSIGIAFSKDSIFYNANITPVLTSLNFALKPHSPIVDTENWVLLKGKYKANGDEKYLIIGNFNTDSNTDIIEVEQKDSTLNYSPISYYIIDDVSVYECEEDSIPTEPPPASDSSLHYKVPNVISPNADGLNDAFVLESRGIKEVSVKVYNRWGELVQSTKYNVQITDVLSKTILWDATHKGQPAPQGVYYYLIELSTKNGEVIIEKGTVTVL
jgi:gliding motility-associated-like protein